MLVVQFLERFAVFVASRVRSDRFVGVDERMEDILLRFFSAIRDLHQPETTGPLGLTRVVLQQFAVGQEMARETGPGRTRVDRRTRKKLKNNNSQQYGRLRIYQCNITL